MKDFYKLGTTWFGKTRKMTVPEEQEAILKAEPKRRLKKKEIEDRTKVLIHDTVEKLYEDFADEPICDYTPTDPIEMGAQK